MEPTGDLESMAPGLRNVSCGGTAALPMAIRAHQMHPNIAMSAVSYS